MILLSENGFISYVDGFFSYVFRSGGFLSYVDGFFSYVDGFISYAIIYGKLFTGPGTDWHLKHETGLNNNVCREGIKLEEALKPLLNLACEERIVFICITRHMNTIAIRRKKKL